MEFKIFDFLKSKKINVVVTAINIKLQGHTHSLNGMEVKESSFIVDIPFKNKTHTDLLTEATSFKAEKAKALVIKEIVVDEPFKLISVEPMAPIEVKADEKVDFKFTIEPPPHNYTGPMSISFVTDNIESIHIEITKTILDFKGTKTTIETASKILNSQKGQIFSEKVQLYKAMSYGDKISKIEIAKPFEFVSSDPKLPLQIDDTNSYILNLYIKAPYSPYAGPLEIKID